MSLMSRKSPTHSHLTHRVGHKHDSLHTVTSGKKHAEANPDGTPRQSPFGELKYESTPQDAKPAYKTIFGL